MMKPSLNHPPHTPQTPHRTDEPDIGSGDKSPGQVDTENMIEQVPRQPHAPKAPEKQQH